MGQGLNDDVTMNDDGHTTVEQQPHEDNGRTPMTDTNEVDAHTKDTITAIDGVHRNGGQT